MSTQDKEKKLNEDHTLMFVKQAIKEKPWGDIAKSMCEQYKDKLGIERSLCSYNPLITTGATSILNVFRDR